MAELIVGRLFVPQDHHSAGLQCSPEMVTTDSVSTRADEITSHQAPVMSDLSLLQSVV